MISCELCGKMCKSEPGLNRHLRAHSLRERSSAEVKFINQESQMTSTPNDVKMQQALDKLIDMVGTMNERIAALESTPRVVMTTTPTTDKIPYNVNIEKVPVPADIEAAAEEVLGKQFQIILVPSATEPTYQLTVRVPDHLSAEFSKRTDIKFKDEPARRNEWDDRSIIIPFGAGGALKAKEFFSRIRNNIYKTFTSQGMAMPQL